MNGYLLCVVAFISCVSVGLVHWRFSLCTMIAWGYFFGILKAHYHATFGHFIFDSATAGFYVSLFLRNLSREDWKTCKPILPWVIWLIGWPVFMALIPIQHYLVQLVGLRGNIFWIPMLLVGFWLDKPAIRLLSLTLAALNTISFCFALAEFFLGVELFVPQNEVTKIVFNSNDMGEGALRIPATFTNAHSYAGTMVTSLPWLIGGLFQRGRRWLDLPLLVLGVLSGILGVFIAGPRLPVVVLGLMVILGVLWGRINAGAFLVLLFIGSIAGYFISQDARLQRFTTLNDVDMLVDRFGISVNKSFFEVILDFPMGNGIGGGGTSLPYFAAQYLTNATIVENEYARIILEQGVVGFMIMTAFIISVLFKKISKSDPDYMAKSLLWFKNVSSWITAMIGIGMMTTVPGTALLLLSMGFCAAPARYRLGGGKSSSSMPGVSKHEYFANLPAYQRGLVAFR